MRYFLAVVTLACSALALIGCQRSGDPPLPTVMPSPTAQAQPPAVPDTTPKASEVFKEGAPPSATSSNARPVDQSHTLTRQEESTAMPMPGQANDHSTLAKEPAKR